MVDLKETTASIVIIRVHIMYLLTSQRSQFTLMIWRLNNTQWRYGAEVIVRALSQGIITVRANQSCAVYGPTCARAALYPRAATYQISSTTITS